MSKPRQRVRASVSKASNSDLAGKVNPSYYKTGYENLRAIQDYVDSEQVSALRWPTCLSTYDKMFYDHDVKKGYFLSQLFVEKAFVKPDVSFNKQSEASKEAAEFIKWNLANMQTTLLSAIRDAYSCKRYGFSILVKKYATIDTGKYKGVYKYKLDKLSPRAQKTLSKSDPFVIKNGNVVAARQDLSYTNYSSLFQPDMSRFEGKSYVDIPREKFMLFSYDSLNGNPLGCSVLQSVYKPWREKLLIADYQTVGVSKDIGGLPVLYAPSEVLAKAAADPTSDAAKYIKNLMDSMANMHSGETSYMMLPSDITEGSTTQKSFEVKLLGIDGGTGKQFDTSKLIEERQQAILNAFGASFSTLGQKGGGSYALADTQQGTHAFYIEKDINYLLEVFNSELIPQLLALNDIILEDEDMPKLIHGIVDESDVDLASKAIQRATAVGQLPVHPELINEILSELGYNYRITQDIIDDPKKWQKFLEDYMPNSKSRSGDSFNTPSGGLNGTGDSISSEDNDTDNLES